MNVEQVVLVELERLWVQLRQLPHAVEELCERGRHLVGVPVDVAAPVHELVPEGQPVLLHKGLLRNSLQSSRMDFVLTIYLELGCKSADTILSQTDSTAELK